jgi:hypothetical protein
MIMVRFSADCNIMLLLVAYIIFMLSQTTEAAPKAMSQLGHMMGNYVEHQVDEGEAMAIARTLHPELNGGAPGCGVCTAEEIQYCSGPAVIEDHCCCDKRYFEWFPYVPHTCYLRPGCKPNAGDCAQYARLRICCCDKITAIKWKSQAVLPALSWRMCLLCFVCVLLVL